jgi:hypothetical protein
MWRRPQYKASVKFSRRVGHKPGSVISRRPLPGEGPPQNGSYLSRTRVTPRLKRTHGAASRPSEWGKGPTHIPAALLPTGVYRANTSRCCWCALTAPLHPYLREKFPPGRYVSVALSSRSLALGVTQQVLVLRKPGLSSNGCKSHPQPPAPTLPALV